MGLIIIYQIENYNLLQQGTVVPIPTVKLGTTLILTISPFCKLCVVVSAAATFVVKVLTIFSTVPVTCSNFDDIL